MPTGYGIPGFYPNAPAAGTNDSYLQQLQSTLGQMMSGSLFPQTTSQVGVKVQRLTPEEEQSAYNTSGFQGLLSDPNFGQISDQQLRGYYDLSQPYMFGQGMENINQIMSQAGWGPSGSPNQAPSGLQTELAARLKSQLGSQVAQGLIQNASQGATARANLGSNVAGSRYGTLTVPNVFSMGMGTKPGAGGSAVDQNPSTIGTGNNTYTGGNQSMTSQAGQGGFSNVGGSAQTGKGSSGSGSTPAGGGGAWWAGEPQGGWGPGYQSPGYNPSAAPTGAQQDYTDFWNQAGYPSGPNEGGYGQLTQPENPDEMGWISVPGPHESYYGSRATALKNAQNYPGTTWSPIM